MWSLRPGQEAQYLQSGQGRAWQSFVIQSHGWVNSFHIPEKDWKMLLKLEFFAAKRMQESSRVRTCLQLLHSTVQHRQTLTAFISTRLVKYILEKHLLLFATIFAETMPKSTESNRLDTSSPGSCIIFTMAMFCWLLATQNSTSQTRPFPTEPNAYSIKYNQSTNKSRTASDALHNIYVIHE